MLRRRTSKSTTTSYSDLDLNLGPPLRVTDIEHHIPVADDEESLKECLKERENRPSLDFDKQHREEQLDEYKTPVHKKPPNAITHPCNRLLSINKGVPPNHTPPSHTPASYGTSSTNQTPGLVRSRNLQKLSLLGRGGSSQVSSGLEWRAPLCCDRYIKLIFCNSMIV